jgi:hypothetical protein
MSQGPGTGSELAIACDLAHRSVLSLTRVRRAVGAGLALARNRHSRDDRESRQQGRRQKQAGSGEVAQFQKGLVALLDGFDLVTHHDSNLPGVAWNRLGRLVAEVEDIAARPHRSPASKSGRGLAGSVEAKAFGVDVGWVLGEAALLRWGVG